VASVLTGRIQYNIAKTKVALSSFKAYKSGKRFIINQGGSRSGKSYSLIQLLVGLALKEKVSISVCSIAFPHLRKGVIRDWIEIMENSGLYNPNSHSLTESLYKFPNGSYIEFFSVDNSLKVRGPGRDILFINEANLIQKETFEQLNMRTKKAVFIDYNPADENHWIYERILPLPDCEFIQTTYLDNPFLPEVQKKQIESLKDADPNLWKVYGLGERGTTQNTIYHKFDLYDTIEGDHCYGLDFGFNHPNALVKVTRVENNLYAEQKLYQSHLTTSELIKQVKEIVGASLVYCDTARPEIIQELILNGVNAYPADKSVKEGIDFVRSHRIFVHRESIDLQKELRSYKWKQKPTGEILDEPVKMFDDLCDSLRYGAISFKNAYTSPVLMGFR
jgi:phage terminase large subunit